MKRQQKGCIYKSSGAWYARYREDVIQNGRMARKLRCKRLADVSDRYRTKNDVLPLLADILRPLNSNPDLKANMQIGSFIETAYLPHAQGQTHASTYQGYKNKWNNYLRPICSTLWLRDVRTCHIQEVLNTVARTKDLSKTTLRHLKAFLSGVFNFARQQGYFDAANPVEGVAIPQARAAGDTYAYSLEEIIRMLLYMPEPAATVLATAAFTGLRRSELQGLEWSDYAGEELRVTRAIWNGVVSDPKTRKSKAAIPVIPRLKNILDRHRLLAGKPESGPIFANSEKHPLCLNNLANRVIVPTLNVCAHCRKTEEDHARETHKYERDSLRPEWHGYHAFRRGLATNLYRLGTPDKTIQAILRHSNLSTTMNVYVKTVDADTVKAMAALDEMFNQCSKNLSATLPA
ncbi:MAG: tyrosine-type recombinase/integrase [Terriglobales bacterium]